MYENNHNHSIRANILYFQQYIVHGKAVDGFWLKSVEIMTSEKTSQIVCQHTQFHPRTMAMPNIFSKYNLRLWTIKSIV